MAKVYQNLSVLVGNTPLFELTHVEKAEDLDAKVVV